MLRKMCQSPTMKPTLCVCVYIYIYIYIYIYLYLSLRKNKTGHIRIINLFPSCYVFDINQKHEKN